MGDVKVPLQNSDLHQIGEYVQSNLGQWIEQAGFRVTSRDRELDLLERIVRVEEELKTQRELMKQGFEQMNMRFDQTEKRFTMLQWFIGLGFTVVAVLTTVFSLLK